MTFALDAFSSLRYCEGASEKVVSLPWDDCGEDSTCLQERPDQGEASSESVSQSGMSPTPCI